MEELAEQGRTAKDRASRSRLPGRIQLLTYLGCVVLEDQEGVIIRWLVAGSI